MVRNGAAFSGGRRFSGGGPVRTVHIVLAATLLLGIFVVAPLLVWFEGWRDAQRSLVEVSSSPRLVRAEAALRDLDACLIEYERVGPNRWKGPRSPDVLIVGACGASARKRYAVPDRWKGASYGHVRFWLERDSRSEAWLVHGSATPDELAKALEEASPALRRKAQ